jgi:methylated-DNA-[protein]-cysteine S-methyltransferase
MILYSGVYSSPFGDLITAVDDDDVLIRVILPNGHDYWQSEIAKKHYQVIDAPERNVQVFAQLDEYFQQKRTTFDLPLRTEGTAFQRSVWSALQTIPYGTTISYGQLADRINKRAAVRAVGAANGANPIPIVIPCHRVIGADGSLTGFGGGLALKEQLLTLEGAYMPAASKVQHKAQQLSFV